VPALPGGGRIKLCFQRAGHFSIVTPKLYSQRKRRRGRQRRFPVKQKLLNWPLGPILGLIWTWKRPRGSTWPEVWPGRPLSRRVVVHPSGRKR